MKILLLSTYAEGGGAAHATHRLYEALDSLGVEVRLLTLLPDSRGYDPSTSITLAINGAKGKASSKAMNGHVQIKARNISTSTPNSITESLSEEISSEEKSKATYSRDDHSDLGAASSGFATSQLTPTANGSFEITNRARIQAVATTSLKRLRAKAYLALERIELMHASHYRCGRLWSCSTASLGYDLSLHPWMQWADVIHLHWINQGFLSLDALRRIATLGKPIAWTLHDLWAVTGICHIPIQMSRDTMQVCPRFRLGCGLCPLLGSGASIEDLSLRTRRRKDFLRHRPFHYIAVSDREADLFCEGHQMQGTERPIVIPPALSLERYPLRTTMNVGEHRLLVLASKLDDPVKGAHLLTEVCHALVDLSKGSERTISFDLVGAVADHQIFEHMPLPIRLHGRVPSDQIQQFYHLASLTLSTSLFETFGQTLTESLACGTPVVSFASYGPESIVRNGVNGYLASAYNAKAMARLILRALDDIEHGDLSPHECRASVSHLDLNPIGRRHVAYYTHLLSDQHS